MFDKLKKQPLIGLALAITSGYVLAHILTRALDITYKDALDSDPASAAAWLILIAVVALICWKRRSIAHWFRRRKAGVKPSSRQTPRSVAFRAMSYSFAIVSLFLLALASLADREASPLFGIAMAVGALVLTYRFIAKAIRWRRNEPWRTNPLNDPKFVAANPRTAAWASKGNNAAVASAEGIGQPAQI